MTPHRIVFFGTSDFSVPILERLAALPEFEVVEVVTQPDRPVGRHKAMQAPPVKRLASTLGIPVHQPEKVRGEEALAHFRKLDADVYVVVSYGKILPKALLEIPEYGAVNIHGSLLPKHRGASPVSGAILAGDDVTGISVIKMNEKMDEGPVIAFSEDIPVGPEETRESLREKLQKVASDMIGPTLMDYLEGRVEPKPQDHAKATATPILKREDGHIDWSRSAVEIDRRIRGLYPWPGTHAVWNRDGKELRLAILAADIAHPEAPCRIGKPGEVIKGAGGTLLVDCGKGCLSLTRVRLEGKRETDGPAFLNGHPDIEGQTLA